MEAAVATKFVKWEVPTLESLHECKVYRLRMKVNNGEVLNREEKNWITEKVNGNTYFKSAIPLQGWRFDCVKVETWDAWLTLTCVVTQLSRV